MTDGRVTPVVSLRVPGVEHPSAEPVLELDALWTEQVESVTRGEFWRWRRPPLPKRYLAEAYLWGARSSPGVRALWMLLLPFTLINVAYWARPAPRRGMVSWVADRAFGVVCRVLALTLTATLTLAVAGVTMDLIAWQCLGRGQACTQRWAQPFNLIGEVRATFGQRLVVAALVPLALLWMLWLLSFRTWLRYERRRLGIDVRSDGLTDARFWIGRSWVERLRASHVLAGTAIVDAAVVYPVLRFDADDRGWLAAAGVLLLCLAGAMLAMAVFGVVAPLPERSPEAKTVRDAPALAAPRRLRLAAGVRVHAWVAKRVDVLVESARAGARAVSTPVTRAVRGAATAAVVVTAVCLAYAALPRTGAGTSAGALPGYAGTAAVLSVLQTLLLFAMAFAVAPLAWTAVRSRRRVALRGLAAPILATVAVMIAAWEAASLLYFSALLIGQLQTTGTGRAWEPAPPYPYQWAGLVFVLAVAAGLAAAVTQRLRWWSLLRRGRQVTDERYAGLRQDLPETALVLDRAHARGLVLETVPALMLIVFVPMAALSLAAVCYSAIGRGPETLLPTQRALANLGTWSIGLVALVLVFVAVRAGTTTPVRRIVSAIWATATFWPRAAHPFAAPAHGPRAVADLVLRVNRLVERGHSVLLAAHSHGALLATTAVLYLPEESLRRTALLTSASPVTRLMEPYFGAFYHRQVLGEVADRLTDEDGTRWCNLYRITDPIGGRVFPEPTGDGPASGVDVLVPDPDLSDVDIDADVAVQAHRHYFHDGVFLTRHADFVDRLAARASRRPGRGKGQ